MKQSIHKNDNNFDTYNTVDDLVIQDHNHSISWNISKAGNSFLGVSKTRHASTVSITAREGYEEPRKNKRARRISREVRFELNLDSAKALRDLLDEIIEIEGGE